jgi:hypothetical protein
MAGQHFTAPSPTYDGRGGGSPSSLDLAILEYLPLDNHGDIRLLTIHPGTGAELLVLGVYQGNLDRAPLPQFDALRYVGGIKRTSRRPRLECTARTTEMLGQERP